MKVDGLTNDEVKSHLQVGFQSWSLNSILCCEWSFFTQMMMVVNVLLCCFRSSDCITANLRLLPQINMHYWERCFPPDPSTGSQSRPIQKIARPQALFGCLELLEEESTVQSAKKIMGKSESYSWRRHGKGSSNEEKEWWNQYIKNNRKIT